MNLQKESELVLASSFQYLTPDLKTKLFSIAEKNVQFSIGLGIGFGRFFTYLPPEVRKDVYTRAVAGSGLARGLGIGIGSIFTYLPDDLRCEMQRKQLEAMMNRQHDNVSKG